ncbi:hypothetical protein N5J48_11770 [Acinetobacter ursingii]|uniref:hypothetical protein n=1 Tax=Acinetobacter ursingii TaxID=108980 RepID=UPI001C098AC3|nr:hypothetical protein [Acinetobacter ursingii]MDG9860973.1 hypothetical protein [Acinetobacter ursingii]MDG9892245.1 hypothetical protein [Acinetobacter ursingii]MDH0005958.1 hypothetical protein [Acinetobacter ursingii]MDH0477496.1 hypothetical protein [Acinetobacter ursingii]MDH2118335.1 hypothetical protein [Acinetobacter ursingii]
MIKPSYLSPIISSIMNQSIIANRSIKKKKGETRRSRSSIVLNQSRPMVKDYVYRMFCSGILPMLDWDFSKNLCFNPKKIQKVSDRKHRKACYQAFAIYKKSFKPMPKPKLKIWRDEWPRLIKRATQVWSDPAVDAFSFFSHCVDQKAKFAAQYECRWDLGTDLS